MAEEKLSTEKVISLVEGKDKERLLSIQKNIINYFNSDPTLKNHLASNPSGLAADHTSILYNIPGVGHLWGKEVIKILKED